MTKTQMTHWGRKHHETLQALYQPDMKYLKYFIVRPVGVSSTPLTSGENANGVQEGAEERERHAMLTYVVKDMPTELYTELLEGFRMPGQVLYDYASSVLV
jgi:hypothetical protein